MVFLKDVTVTASVDGTQIANANSYWSAPEPFPPAGPKALTTVWTYPAGITLGAGQSMIFATDGVLAHAIGAVPNVLGPDDTATAMGSLRRRRHPCRQHYWRPDHLYDHRHLILSAATSPGTASGRWCPAGSSGFRAGSSARKRAAVGRRPKTDV